MRIEFKKIKSLESKGNIELGNTDARFILEIEDIENEEEIFSNLRENGYGNNEIEKLESQNKKLRESNDKLREALEELTKPIDKDSRLNMDDIAEYFKEIRQKFNLSETPNSSKEGV